MPQYSPESVRSVMAAHDIFLEKCVRRHLYSVTKQMFSLLSLINLPCRKKCIYKVLNIRALFFDGNGNDVKTDFALVLAAVHVFPR